MTTLFRPRYFAPAAHEPRRLDVDVCIYGGTSGGVVAAIECSRRGHSVALLEASAHVGGLSAGGLSLTDVGNKHVIGGLSREFYQRTGAHYGVEADWRFEPHVAEQIFMAWLAEAGVRVLTGQFVSGVAKRGNRIEGLQTLSGLEVRARIFLDASYEGDLLARAGVSFSVGREGNAEFGETLNGAQIQSGHQFVAPVDPYCVAGVPASGLLPGVEPGDDYVAGRGDHRVQSYNFRMCLTRRPDIRIPFPKPEDFDPAWHILLKRHLATGWNEAFEKFDEIRGGKTDTNNHGAVSTDFIGQNHRWPRASYEERERIFQQHVAYQQGVMWTLANDPEVTAAIREPMSEWGLCADEFTDGGGWPHALYVREARRMVSAYVMTEHNCRGAVEAEDSVGMAAYCMDSHNCRRLVRDGRVWNEGDVQVGGMLPYPVAYRSIVPHEAECSNLLVPFCLSATHISFGSIRMEPVFMILSQSAAIAADLALGAGCPVQRVPYSELEPALLEAGQILRPPQDISAFIIGKSGAEALVAV